jgi:hypothetical protein
MPLTPQDVYRCFESVLGLPLNQQAQCVRLAAEGSVHVWRQHCERRGIEDLSPALLECFDRWRAGMATDEQLSQVAERFSSLLPADLRLEDAPAGGYAGYALADIALIALRQCGEVHHSVLHTAIYFAASACCGIGIEAVWVVLERLTEPELAFLEKWWGQCRTEFPELAEEA